MSGNAMVNSSTAVAVLASIHGIRYRASPSNGQLVCCNSQRRARLRSRIRRVDDVGERVTDELGAHSELRVQRRLERIQRHHEISCMADTFDTPPAPRINGRADVVNGRDPASFQQSLEQQIENVEVDTDEYVRAFHEERAAQGANHAKQIRETFERIDEAVHRERADRGNRFQSLFEHQRSADTPKAYVRNLRPQCLHQAGTQQISRRLTRDNSNADAAPLNRRCPRAGRERFPNATQQRSS